MRQIVKPLIEMLAAIPSVAYGFFALVVFAPALQNQGGIILSVGTWLVLGPLAILAAILLSEFIAKVAGHLSKNANQIRLIFKLTRLCIYIFDL